MKKKSLIYFVLFLFFLICDAKNTNRWFGFLLKKSNENYIQLGFITTKADEEIVKRKANKNASLQIGLPQTITPHNIEALNSVITLPYELGRVHFISPLVDNINYQNKFQKYDSIPKSKILGKIGNIINNYTPITFLNACSNNITVEDASSFNTGDTVLIIQMKGAALDFSNTATSGTITDYKNAGNYEFNYVKNKSGNIIELLDSLTRNYDVPFGKVQLVRVPNYKSANISSTLTCLPWDGNKGGVLVLNATDSVNLQADIDVSAKGFSGGNSPNTGSTTLMCFKNDYNYPKGSVIAAAKGEGIGLVSDDIAWGKGSPANAGGGGIGHNSGGGGGGNGGVGGMGGYQLEACGNAPFDNRGLGSKALNYSNAQNKVFMGGGGGSGHTDNAGGSDMNGGNGAGIVIINTKFIKSNGFNIIAKGGDAPQCSNAVFNCHDGSGGGGGGGSVLINSFNYLDAAQLNCSGGKGGDLVIFNNTNAGRIGPGGGGGAGISWLNNTVLPGAVSSILTGGINGVIILDNKNPWGATPGLAGVNLLNLKLPFDDKLFKKNIDSTRIKFNISTCNTINFKGYAFINKNSIVKWLWDFGDNSTADNQNIIHIFSVAGTYNITLFVTDNTGCTDSAKATITTTGDGPGDFSYKQDICNPLSIQFLASGATPINPKWFFGDGNTSTGVANPTNLYAAPETYTVKYITQNTGCTDTITKNIVVGFTKDDIILTHDTTICYGSTKKLLTTPALLDFCWTPTTYLSDANSPNPTTNTTVPITYYFTAAIPGNNLIINGDFNTGNTGFTSQYIYATPNTTEGQYFVGSNVQAWNALMSNCADHTTGTGNMLLVNGSSVPDIGVWNQTVTVTPNTNYAFSTWIQSLYPPNPAQLSFSINGTDIGTPITASSTNCVWTQFYTTWNSGNNITASIAIINKNTLVQGNDFALDDIAFSAVTIKRDSVIILIDTPVVKSGRDTTICAGEPVQLLASGAATYSWTPATALSNAGISNPVATPVITTQYIVTGINANGCSAADTVVISTNPLPLVKRTADTLICSNTTAQLWATGGNSYKWSPAGSLSDPSIANPVASPVINTMYYLLVTGANKCSAKDSIKVSIRPAGVFAVSPPDTTCTDKAVQLSASGGDSYLWSPAAKVSNASIANPLSATNTDAIYTVLIKDNTCNISKKLTTSLTVFTAPIINVTKANDISCIVNTAQLTASGATLYSWSPATGLSDTSIANPVASPATTTNYIVTGFDHVTKCSATNNITVLITKDGEPKFFIPTAFSPNGDGLNECFKVAHFNYLKSIEISIYNRFGNIVFYTTTDNDCWDGTYKGKPMDAGNFVYYIKTQNNCGVFYKKGNLILIR